MKNKIRITDALGTQEYHQSERVLINDEGYYYRTREEGVMGPFYTESEALFDLNVFLKVTDIEKEIQLDFH